MDYIDIYHLHAVHATDYEFAKNDLVPELKRMQDKGKIRFIGITEAFGEDVSHEMLKLAVQDDCWDVMMVGFNLLNQSAREYIFKETIAKNIGTMIMFAVRRALSQPAVLKEIMDGLLQEGYFQGKDFDKANPLGFLVHEQGGESLTDAAYRYCRHEAGAHTILSGTGNIQHLIENIKSVNRGPLPEKDLQKVNDLFKGLAILSGN